MIEMRVVDYGPMCRPDFQYRHLVFGVDASGALCSGNGWSDWKVAPYVNLMETQND